MWSIVIDTSEEVCCEKINVVHNDWLNVRCRELLINSLAYTKLDIECDYMPPSWLEC